MAKTETFQDLSLAASAAGQELWRCSTPNFAPPYWMAALKRVSASSLHAKPARQYDVSRGTVIAAVRAVTGPNATLRTETGSGTYVAPGFAGPLHDPQEPWSRARFAGFAGGIVEARTRIVERHPGHARVALDRQRHSAAMSPRSIFSPSICGHELRPVCCGRAPRSLYGQGSAGGYQPLRRAIAEYVGGSRGVRCSPDQVIVTSGARRHSTWFARLLAGSRRSRLDGRSGLPRARGLRCAPRGRTSFPCRWTRRE